MVAGEESSFSSRHPKANNRYYKEEIVKSLVLNRFTKWKAARALRTKKAMLDLLWVVLSARGVGTGRWASTQKTLLDRTVPSSVFATRLMQKHYLGFFLRSPVVQPGFSMFVRGFGVLGSSKMQFVPISGGDHMLMKWWFSQLVEAGAGGKPILFLVWSRYLPGMTCTISWFQHRFSVGCGYIKKHDTKQLEYWYYWESCLDVVEQKLMTNGKYNRNVTFVNSTRKKKSCNLRTGNKKCGISWELIRGLREEKG